MTIYVDLLFIVNWVLNSLVLAAAAALAREKLHRLRLLTAAALGALYSVMMFFPETEFLYRAVIRLVTGAVMVLIGLPTPSLRRFLRALLCFYISLGVFGGGMYIFYNFTAAGANMVYSNGVYYVDLPLWMLLVLSFGFYGVIRLTAFVQYRRRPTEGLVEVEICCRGQYRTLTAFLDTGNSLVDPMTLSPVVVAEAAALKGMLPAELLSAVREGRPELLAELSAQHSGLKCRLIPYKGAVGESCLLFAVRPDWIRRLPDGAPVENVLLGLTGHKLSEEYQVLLHGEGL
ncbi:MAG: sigma-E processing peptidase SpoIIGA [Clostridia bacterium]|nr:sigma-E processing peptidase SpoIIGA [Clostridia bacterium]